MRESSVHFQGLRVAAFESRRANEMAGFIKNHGGIRMYAEVYKWFTETSGVGLLEQVAKLVRPKQVAKEEDVVEAIELWEEKEFV